MKYSLLALLLAPLMVALAPVAAAQLSMSGPDVQVKPYVGQSGVQPGESIRLAFSFELPAPWHVNSHTPLDEFLIPTELTLAENDAYEVVRVVYPEHEEINFAFQEEPLAVYEGTFTVGVMLKVQDGVAPGNLTVSGSLRYQACNDKQCAPPKTVEVMTRVAVVAAGAETTAQHAEVLGALAWDKTAEESTADDPAPKATAEAEAAPVELSGDWESLADGFAIVGRTEYVNTDGFVAFIDRAESGAPVDEGYFAGMTWWLIVLSVLAGGLALNLTPCVLPLIPINIAIIGAGAKAGSKLRGFSLGGAYGIGISMVYGTLGLLVVLGVSKAFGTINSSPWFNAGIAVLFIVLGLAMFDLIVIDFSKWQAKFGIRKNEGGSFLVAFGMGCISALLAGACVAPVVIGVITYTQKLYADGSTIALALPFLLGVGMALPWPFAGAGLSFLPKPGGWMEKVKWAFGALFIAVALYFYAWPAYQQFANRFVDEEAVAASVAELDAYGWQTNLEAGLAEAKETGKPVLIDFWATWCKNCKVMNETTLKDEAVLSRLEDYVKIKYQAEDPGASPVSEVWDYFELKGLPTYLILQAK